MTVEPSTSPSNAPKRAPERKLQVQAMELVLVAVENGPKLEEAVTVMLGKTKRTMARVARVLGRKIQRQ